MKPNPDNACSGKYPDWLEVNLLPECNGICSWCVEKKGWHPTNKATWIEIVHKIVESGKNNIILLGGEPTIYPDLKEIICYLQSKGKSVYITTNGSMLSRSFVEKNLRGITGVNISIHHWNGLVNHRITGIWLPSSLRTSISILKQWGVTVRLNCNCIRGHVDSVANILNYIEFAKDWGVDSVRFAELKDDDKNFVDLAALFPDYGLSNDPFKDGCSVNKEINGMKVNFRLMCGLQTKMRPKPENPEQVPHEVLYYDGNMYQGWQLRGKMKGEESQMKDKDLIKLLERVASKDVNVSEAALVIQRAILKREQEVIAVERATESSDCRY